MLWCAMRSVYILASLISDLLMEDKPTWCFSKMRGIEQEKPERKGNAQYGLLQWIYCMWSRMYPAAEINLSSRLKKVKYAVA